MPLLYWILNLEYQAYLSNPNICGCELFWVFFCSCKIHLLHLRLRVSTSNTPNQGVFWQNPNSKQETRVNAFNMWNLLQIFYSKSISIISKKIISLVLRKFKVYFFKLKQKFNKDKTIFLRYLINLCFSFSCFQLFWC